MIPTLNEIRVASAQKLAEERAVAAGTSETSPDSIHEGVARFANTLQAEPPVFLPVRPDGFGLYGWCSDGVMEKVRVVGGSPVFGWTIWEWPGALLTAEFHCVWQSDDGELIDITPKPKNEQRIVFVADHSYPTNFNFDERPRNRRMRLYPDTDKAVAAAAIESSLSDSQRAYETRRAEKTGILLSEWLARKVPNNPVADAIDEVIASCSLLEEHVDSLGTPQFFQPDARFFSLHKRREKAVKDFKAMLFSRNKKDTLNGAI